MLLRFFAGMLAIGMMVLGAGSVSGQTASTGSGQAASTGSGHAYPNKPIRIVTFDVGGSSDLMARLIAQGISGPLGQQMIVDNRAAIIAIETVAKAPPDGYTLLFHGSTVWLAPLLQNTSYDPLRDVLPITMVASSPNILVVHPSLPAKSVKELIALAKAKPGELNYATGPTGSSIHLAAELFKATVSVNIVRIPYKGAGPALNSLIGGHVHLMFASVASGMTHVKSGRLRALAVTSAEPSALAPGLPTVAASGLPGYVAASITGIFAPAKTAAPLINRLNQEIVRFLKTTEAKEKLLGYGVDAVGSAPEEFAAIIKSEMARMGKVIKDAGIRAD